MPFFDDVGFWKRAQITANDFQLAGIPPFDFAAFQAIVKSSPFRPLPRRSRHSPSRRNANFKELPL